MLSRQRNYRFHTPLLLCLILLLAPLAIAQPDGPEAGDNLLVNPGFEAPYIEVGEEDLVAEGWSEWSALPLASRPLFTQVSADDNPDRVLEGESAQVMISFLSTHAAGVYQTVSELEPGTALQFSVNAYVWSTRDTSNPDLSVDPGDVIVQVGIDPTGDIDPDSIAIVWSDPVSLYDSYNPYTVIAIAQSDTVTVFVRSIAQLARLQTEVYLDAAALVAVDLDALEFPPEATPETEATTEAQPPAPVEPVVTDEPTAELIATDAPPEVVPLPDEPPTQAPPVDEAPTADPATEGLIQTATAAQQTLEAVLTALPTEGATATPAVIIVTTTPEPTQPPAPDTTVTDAEEVTEGVAVDAVPESTLIALATSGQQTLEAVLTPGIAGTQAVEEVVAQIPSATPTVDVPGILAQYPFAISYTVQAGDTVANLAQAYGSRVDDILAVNELDARGFIVPGQVLTIPARTQPTPVPLPAETEVYVIRPGDTLSGLAQRYGTSVAVLARLNGIVNTNSLSVGQVIRVPRDGSPLVTATPPPTATPAFRTTYVVQPGDTLFAIALRFNVTVQQLAEVNNIRNINRINRGQVLIIP